MAINANDMVTITGYDRVRTGGYNAVLSIEREDEDEIITLTEVKAHLRVDFADDDTLLTALITSCRKLVELYTGLALVPTTVTAVLHNDVAGMELPCGPYTEGFSAIYGTDDTALTTDEYKLRGTRFPSLIQSLTCDLTVTYSAGYDADTIPPELKLAVLNEIAYRYEHRGDDTAQGRSILQSPGARSIADSKKRSTWII